MFFLEWLYKLLFGEDALEDLREQPRRKRK